MAPEQAKKKKVVVWGQRPTQKDKPGLAVKCGMVDGELRGGCGTMNHAMAPGADVYRCWKCGAEIHPRQEG